MSEVTDVIVARRQRPERFSAMVIGSVAAHAGVLLFLLFGPLDWHIDADDSPRTVMTISLSGAPGPRTGGMTPMGGRAAPPPPPEAAPSVVPPAPKPSERVAPRRTPRRRQPPQAAERAETGVTRTETGARGKGFGLTTGGAGGSGVQLDVANFCCPEYIEQMVTLIQRNWQANQGVTGRTVMKFTITRRGSIEGVAIEGPSGFLALDLAAERALLVSRLPELPPQFSNATLTVHLTFEYQRQ